MEKDTRTPKENAELRKEGNIPHSGKKTILLVEDDHLLGDVLLQKLRESGLSVLHAGDAQTALIKIREEKPDLILLDLVLPGMSGFDILREVKENTETANIVVIILSNLGQKEDLERATALGADDFLIKANFTPSEIAAKVQKIFQENNLRQSEL